MKIILLVTLGFASLANAQDSISIPVEVQEVQAGFDVTILVKQGCNLTGWQSASKNAHTFFVSCGNKKKAVIVNGLGKLDNVAVLTAEQDAPVTVQRSGKYGVNWDKLSKDLNKTQTKIIP